MLVCRGGTLRSANPYRGPIIKTAAIHLQFVLDRTFPSRRVVMSKMNPWAKAGLVIGGYVLACLAASGAVYVNGLLTPDAVKQASSGMSAFGDLILLVGVFGFCALFPTALTLYFLVMQFMPRKPKQEPA
jgi:hypothetical protein